MRAGVEAPRPAGCQTPIALVRRMVAGTEAADLFEDLIRGRPGGDNNPFGRAGKPAEEINRDNITVDSPEPATIPLSAGIPRPRRDRTREAPTGTSASYSIRRLKDNRPDLLEKVQAGELSCNAAMIAAGRGAAGRDEGGMRGRLSRKFRFDKRGSVGSLSRDCLWACIPWW